ncbi:MAG: cytochrome c3 family protein [Proteobacteria bacterium]|nr:cytochrome c3 family protein [Pseudomonadota bacterium]MBU1688542.1 cytochrome c3 family protein [Pseudomonadota bacterium]
MSILGIRVHKFIIAGSLISAALLGGCGSDGSNGAAGTNGLSAYEVAVENGYTGTETEWLADMAPTAAASVELESCVVCHKDAGSDHQAEYDELYQDGVIQITDFAYTYAVDTAILTFKMTQDGEAFDCTKADSMGSYFAAYDGTGFPSNLSLAGTRTYDAATNVCTSTKTITGAEDLSLKDGIITLYGSDEILYINSAKHISSPKYPYAALLETGNGVDYVSTANVTGCERCHTKPYLKHTYIYGDVGGDEFYTCKGCHYDTRTGGHVDWQVLVDNPARYADIVNTPLTDDEKTQYAYIAKLMNDVHMSHAMEFGYPQSMANCATCHEGKLDRTTTDANFTAETCKSCHPITGPADGTAANRAPALTTIWTDAGVDSFHSITATCNDCHKVGGSGKVFSAIHTGYNSMIYADTAGTKYSDAITASVDSASLSANVLTISFGATGSAGGLTAADITPTVLISLYGYDTKDFLVSCHGRSFDDNGDGSINSSDNRDLEYAIGVAGDSTTRFSTVSNADGSWVVTADLTAWADLIADGSVKRAEIALQPTLIDANDVKVALDAPSRTFDIAANAFDDTFFSPIVKVADGCNSCHDALATTFHSADRGGNIVVCRMCHTVASGGSHLEMQSRSIDSYVHAIHSFQPFDIGDIDFTDPVEAVHYEHHIESDYPTFGIQNCESCHNTGTYDVPDQSKSMPGKLSGSDTVAGRNIGTVASVVTGPGSRACGSCHRAKMINEDKAGELAAFNQHTKTNGYMVADDDDVFDTVVKTIMGMFL